MAKAQDLVVFAMKRSGNNALKFWLVRGKWMAIQGNCRPKHFTGYDPPEVPEFREPVAMPLDMRGLRKHGTTRFRLACLFKRPFYLGIEDQTYFPHALPHATSILLVRSAENVFAGRLARSHEGHPEYPGELGPVLQRKIETWCQHAETAIATVGPDGIPPSPDEVLPIYYDRWLIDSGYRAALGEMLGLSHPSELPTNRGQGGKGSSFNGYRPLEDSASRRELLQRAQLLDPTLRAVLDSVLANPRLTAAQRSLNAIHGT